MRLLVYGHHSHTGFGVVTQNLAERFVRAGIDVRVIAVNHRGEPVRGDLAGRVWPAGIFGDQFGGNWSQAAIAGTAWTKLEPDDVWQPDAVLVIADVSGLLGHMGRNGISDEWRSLPVYHYCPIEGDNLSLGWRTIWNAIQPVAMSDFGARVIGEHIGRSIPRIYHGVDSATFRPVSFTDPLRIDGRTLRSKEDCKALWAERLELDPSRQMLLRTDRNVTRKNYPDLFRFWSILAPQMPEVDLVLHCRPQDNEGPDLVEDFARLTDDARSRIRWTQAHDTFKGLTTDGLVSLMNAADVYVSTTGGEGFGLTLAESLACEVPVVVTDWAADAETVGPGGYLVPPLTDTYGEPVRNHSSYGMDWAVPDPRAFIEPVRDLLTHRKRREALGRMGRRHVVRSFSWDTAAAEFLTLFATPVEAAA